MRIRYESLVLRTSSFKNKLVHKLLKTCQVVFSDEEDNVSPLPQPVMLVLTVVVLHLVMLAVELPRVLVEVIENQL